MRPQRRLKNNLVIVCEGTDTEYLYFYDVALYVQSTQPERFGLIKVVPSPKDVSEMIVVRQAYKRKMRPDDRGGTHPECLYYVKEDHSKAEYDKNKAYPARFVREAQLFLEEDEFTEAWAIYDKDIHPGHKRAIELANQDSRLHIGYSAYSFEEWILCHFERNAYSYRHSVCEKKDCGVNNARCKGHDCLVGRIRQKGYIGNYKKNISGLFKHYLYNRIKMALINVSWLRFIGRIHEKELDMKLYQRNPYTTIDRFVTYLINVPERYEWHSLKELFVFEKDEFYVDVKGDFLFIQLKGRGVHPLRDDRLFYCDENGNRSSSLITNPITLYDGRNEIKQRINKSERYICLEEPKSLEYKVVIIELPIFS